MKIAIDSIIFQLQWGHFRGVSRVWANILPYIKNTLEKENELILLTRGHTQSLNFGMKTQQIPVYTNQRMVEDGVMLTSVCKKLGVDLFISTYHTKAPGIKNVIMVHDLIPEIRSWLRGCNEYVARSKSYLNADVLICVSENTRKDLYKWYPTLDVNRIHMVLEGVSSKEFHPLVSCENVGFLKKYGLKSNYFVLDGDITQEVSEVFCRAFSLLNTNYSLFWYGGALQSYMINSCTKYKIPHRKAGWLNAGEVPLALSGAQGLIFISDDEGFGLPVLEAMACRTPVLCSHTASLPEVGGDSVQYFVNHGFECMKDSLSSFLNVENRKRIAEKGFSRSKAFTWEKMAEKIVKIVLK